MTPPTIHLRTTAQNDLVVTKCGERVGKRSATSWASDVDCPACLELMKRKVAT